MYVKNIAQARYYKFKKFWLFFAGGKY